MNQPHVAAIVALLNAAGVSVYDAEAESPDYNPANWAGTWTAAQQRSWQLAYPYTVIFAPAFMREALTLSKAKKDINDGFSLLFVGEGAWQVRVLQDKAEAALDRKSPTVAGWKAWTRRVRSGDPMPVTSVSIPTTASHPITATDRYSYRATPTT